MKKVFKRLMSMLVIVSVMVTLTVGYAASAETKIDTSEKVTLKVVLLGDKGQTADKTTTLISSLAEKKINAKIEFENLTWGEWTTKYPLLFSSGADFDLVYVADWTGWNQFANKGAFLELTPELLKKYAPKTWSSVPKAGWEQASVDGKIYMIPQSMTEYNSFGFFVVRGDLRTKYKLPPIKTLSDLEKYCDNVLKYEKGMLPMRGLADGRFNQTIFMDQKNPFTEYPTYMGMGYNTFATKENVKVINKFEQPWYKKYVSKMNQYMKKGYWSKNVLTDKETDQFKNGKSAVISHNLGSCANAIADYSVSKPNWKVELVNLCPDMPQVPSKYTQNGFAINAATKNPERALMFNELAVWDKEMNDLCFHGIEGADFKAVGKDKYLPVANSNGSIGSNWGWKSPLSRWNAGIPDYIKKIGDDYAKKYKDYPYMFGFQFDDSNVKNEVAALTNLVKQYVDPMNVGLIDFNRGYKQYMTEAKKAGWDKVFKEYQSQINEWKKTHK